MRDPQALHKIVQETRDLPTLPAVVARVGEMVRNPRVSAGDVGKAISEDQALTAKVLRLVNSAFYGFPQQVNSITRAVVILGFSRIRNLALTASVLTALPSRHRAFSVHAFWTHSIATAVASDAIARVLRYTGEEENAFVAGLLHDVGKLAEMHLFADEFGEVLERVARDDSLIGQAEEHVMGVTHAQIGGWLAERWNFPAALSVAIRLHHQPDLAREHRKLAMIVHLADILARAGALGSGGDMRIPVVEPTAWNELGVTRDALDRCMQEMSDGVERSKEFLELLDHD